MPILKHIDFQVPNFGELASGPDTGVPETVLIQTTASGMPDGPHPSPVGLEVQYTSGSNGNHIAHALTASQDPLHLRFYLNPNTATGGETMVLSGLDASDVVTFEVYLNLNTNQLRIELASGQTLSSSLIAGIDWQCVELAIDRASGVAFLWINGNQHDSVSADLSALDSRTLRLGPVSRDTGNSGSLYLDEWIIADSYIGPIVRETTNDFSDDPARWLVVYNTADSESILWAQAYRDRRNIPYANLLGLNLPLTETIDSTTYLALLSEINDYIDRNNLRTRVRSLLIPAEACGA